MKIAMFTEVFLPKIDGVVTRITRSLEQLAEMGHEVIIFAPGHPPAEYAGFEVIGIPGISFKPVYPEITVARPNVIVPNVLKRFQPDLIHAVNPVWLAAYGVLEAKRTHIPLVCSFHTNVPEYTESLRIGWLRQPAATWIRMLHNRAALNLCTSQQMVDKAIDQGIRNVELWPKAVDTEGYHPSKRNSTSRDKITSGNPDAPVVTYVGRMSREKNLDILAEVMHRVREHIPAARLAMVGSGPAINELKTLFDPAFTTFTGYMSGADLAGAFASGDIFAFPSTTETLGLVALESFASGVPVVGARAGGIPFVIDDGLTGYLVAPEDTDTWAKRIIELLANPEKRAAMGTAARAEAEKWSWRQATEALVDYYEQAIESSPRS